MTANPRRPILTAVRAMHAAEDAREAARGRDPYNSMRVLALSPEAVRERQRREADGILACYETELSVVEPAAPSVPAQPTYQPGVLTRRQAG